MVSTKKSFGNVTLAGIFAAATLAAAVPAFASTNTQITWNFNSPSSWANTTNTTGIDDIGTWATFTGGENPPGSLQPPLSSDLGITAYGEVLTATTTSSVNYQNSWSGWQNPVTTSTGPVYGSGATDLYAKNLGGTENGLGLNGYLDSEIGDATTVSPSVTTYSGQVNTQWGSYYKNKTVTTSTTQDTGMIQLDISNLLTLLGYASNKDATVTIGSLQGSDTAVFSGSGALGDFGTAITSLGSVTSGPQKGNDQTTTFTLNALESYKYLNVTVAAPGQTVLLSTIVLSVPSGSGNPSPAPVPASAGLTLVGALGMGMMLLARRRRSM